MNLKDYLELPYAVVREDEFVGGQQIVVLSHPDLPGCMAQGINFEEALISLDSARRDYIESLLEAGCEIPLPVDKCLVAP